ncbi:MAG TPA: lysozyme inhibitor LprI family protein [Acidimicrobiales bacterium]
MGKSATSRERTSDPWGRHADEIDSHFSVEIDRCVQVRVAPIDVGRTCEDEAMRRFLPLVVLTVAVVVTVIIVNDVHSKSTGSTTLPLTTTTQLSTPPFVRENFTPLACDGNATIGLEGCAERRIVYEDRLINQLRDRVFQSLFDDAARRRFILAENDWFTYRQAACRSESDSNEGGSLAPVDFANCAVRLDQQHITELGAQDASLVIH